MFDQLFQNLESGISIDQYNIHRSKIFQGRSTHEKRITIYLEKHEESYQLMDVLLFSGIKPWYQPWMELIYTDDFSLIKENLSLQFFNSNVENKALELCCNCLPPAGKIFVSYGSDDETRKALMLSIPEVITRLGFLLYSFGFTWYKDWYFPEGGFEGTQKLQGEKPIDTFHKNHQLNKLRNQVSEYLLMKMDSDLLSFIEKRAIKRANIFLNSWP